MLDVRDALIRIGFSENEAEIYIAILRLERAKIAEVLARVEVKRATVYSTIESLIKKGFITGLEIEGRRVYIAEPPERIISKIESKQQELDVQRAIAGRLIKQLQGFQGKDSPRPRVRYYESIEGVRAIQKEFEDQGGDIIQIFRYESFRKLCPPQETREHRKEIIKNKRRVKAIIVTDREVDVPTNPNFEIVTIPSEIAPIEGEVAVCGDEKVALYSLDQEIIAIEIHSKIIAKTIRATLELAWNEAKRLDCKMTKRSR
jgi:sugar-specific transcriptional regulator TrmB